VLKANTKGKLLFIHHMIHVADWVIDVFFKQRLLNLRHKMVNTIF